MHAHTHTRAPTNSMYPNWPMTQAAKKTLPAARTAHVPAEAPSSGRRTQVRESAIHGKGVYAIRPLKAGDTVLEYRKLSALKS